MNKKVVTIIIYLIVVIAVVCLGYFAFNRGNTKVVPEKINLLVTDPVNNATDVAVDKAVTFYFDRTVSKGDNFSIATTPDTELNLSKIDKSLVATPTNLLSSNANYRMVITISSSNQFYYNNKPISTIELSFKTGGNKLLGTKVELTGEAKDNYVAMLKKLPHEDQSFTIFPPDAKGVMKIRLFVFFNAGVNGPPIEQQEAQLKESISLYKTKAIEWIKQQKVDPNILNIKFEY